MKSESCSTLFFFALNLKLALYKEKPTSFSKKKLHISVKLSWEMRGSNPRPPACKAGALNQLS